MGCCGSSRQRWHSGNAGPAKQGHTKHGNGRHPAPQQTYPTLPAGTAPSQKVVMIYQGSGSIVVVGPLTGRRYRFPQPGARLDVDQRDAMRMAKLRQLTIAPKD